MEKMLALVMEEALLSARPSPEGDLQMIVIRLIIMMMMLVIILTYQRGWDTCVPTPKMAYFSVLKAFLFLKYFKNILGLIESSFNPWQVGHQRGWDTCR